MRTAPQLRPACDACAPVSQKQGLSVTYLFEEACVAELLHVQASTRCIFKVAFVLPLTLLNSEPAETPG